MDEQIRRPPPDLGDNCGDDSYCTYLNAAAPSFPPGNIHPCSGRFSSFATKWISSEFNICFLTSNSNHSNDLLPLI